MHAQNTSIRRLTQAPSLDERGVVPSCAGAAGRLATLRGGWRSVVSSWSGSRFGKDYGNLVGGGPV